MGLPVHRDNARSVIVGAIFTVLAVVGIGYGMRPLFGGELQGLPYTYVTAAFKDIGTLRSGLGVRENSGATGKVVATRYENGRAIVTLRLDGKQHVYRNASAQILDESALGQKFVNLNPGTPDSGPLGGAVIPESRNEDASNVDQIFNIFDPPTRQSLDTTLNELGTGLGGRGTDLNDGLKNAPALLDDLGTISSSLSDKKADLVPLLNNANRLTGRFQGRTQQVEHLVTDLNTTLKAINVDNRKPMDQTLKELPPTLVTARAGLRSLDTPLSDLNKTLTTIQPGGRALGRATPDLRGVLREAVPPLNQVPEVSGKAVPAVDATTPAIADARPLVPQVADTLTQARRLLAGLSPYAADVGNLVGQKDLLAGQFSPDQHFFSAQAVFPGLNTAGISDPLARPEFYPAPGTAGPNKPEGQKPDGGDR